MIWGAMKAFERHPAAIYDSPDDAVAYARIQAENTGYDYKVVKFVETHYVRAPQCRCVPTVEEVSHSTPEQPE